jgi:hypothetical protein
VLLCGMSAEPLARDVKGEWGMNSSLRSNAVVQALVACRVRRQLRGTPNDTPDARQVAKDALWNLLESRFSSWDPSARTMAQWAVDIISQPGQGRQQAA